MSTDPKKADAKTEARTSVGFTDGEKQVAAVASVRAHAAPAQPIYMQRVGGGPARLEVYGGEVAVRAMEATGRWKRLDEPAAKQPPPAPTPEPPKTTTGATAPIHYFSDEEQEQ